jgi:hypothetical protein
MKSDNLTLAGLVSLIFLVFVSCQAPAPQQRNDTGRPFDSTGNSLSERSAVPGIFSPSEDQIIKAFAAGEILAKTVSSKANFGQEQVLNVPIPGHNPLKLSITFMPPLEEAKSKGYEFGKRQGRTPDERAERMRLLKKNVNRAVSFKADLPIPSEIQEDENANLPSISVELINVDGQMIEPESQPRFEIPSPKELLASSEQWFSFPLYQGNSPNLTDKMNKMTLVIKIGGEERRSEFRLK